MALHAMLLVQATAGQHDDQAPNHPEPPQFIVVCTAVCAVSPATVALLTPQITVTLLLTLNYFDEADQPKQNTTYTPPLHFNLYL